MIFDRITLTEAYKVLKTVNETEGKVSHILFNRNAFYGTKTVIRFNSVEELKSFIDTELAYKFFDPDCDCGTGNESIYTLLSFVTTIKGKKYPIYINNMRGEMESAQAAIINILNKKALNNTFIGNKRLQFLKENYTCFGYIQEQGDYVNPCDYVEIIKNKFYDELILYFYNQTQNYDL